MNIDQYKGLNKSELSELNPEYSCVICGNLKCRAKHIQDDGKIYSGSCPEHTYIDIDTFAKIYNFNIE